MAKRALVTLLTDFGWSDPYVGAMKGALLRACPSADIVDISHDMPPHDVVATAFVLGHSAPLFPPGTLHVAVVDPEVGTERRVIAARFGGQMFLFPDNGVITMIAALLPLEEMASLRNPRFVPTGVSRTFHGRDVFAPVAGALLRGLDLRQLGPVPDTYRLLDLPGVRLEGAGLVGQVVFVDHFGNLVSNITESTLLERLGRTEGFAVSVGGRTVGALRGTYAAAAPGEPLALINSMGYVEIAVNRGRARDVLGGAFGTEVRVDAV